MKKLLSHFLCLMISILLVVIILPIATLAAGTSEGLQVATPTIAEIRSYYRNADFSFSAADTWETEPIVTSPYAPGALTQASQENALGILNFIRYIAGLDANVVLDQDYIELAQAASLINRVNGGLSHTPMQPADMDDTLYDLCYRGAQRTNLAMGTIFTLSRAITDGWMSDSDSGNIAAVGHRRWVLNPRMGKTGFGRVGMYSAMYAFDTSNSSATQTGVAWPAQNQPVQLFADSDPWSISMNTSSLDASAIEVTLTRRGDGQVWHFNNTSADDAFYVNNQGYGQPGCIIFRPNDVGTYSPDDIFDVVITGANVPISYTVHFFTLDGEDPVDPPESLLGDADCDATVAAADGTLILRYLAGLSTLTEQGLINADTNADSFINAADAAKVLRYLAGFAELD